MSALSIFDDIRFWYPDYKPGVILDVGAHQGDYSKKYASAWPNAKIHAFEPHPVTAMMLRPDLPERVQVHAYALSDHTGTVQMTDNPGNSNNRVTTDGPLTIPCMTGDVWMRENLIDHVDLLKIDAEAHDVQVLRGFGYRLKDVDFVQVETMLNRHDPQGTMYADVYNYMVSQGFYVFNFYDFIWEWKRGTKVLKIELKNPDGTVKTDWSPGAPVARRVDTAYINPKLVGPLMI